jgi:hypothetical protein
MLMRELSALRLVQEQVSSVLGYYGNNHGKNFGLCSHTRLMRVQIVENLASTLKIPLKNKCKG